MIPVRRAVGACLTVALIAGAMAGCGLFQADGPDPVPVPAPATTPPGVQDPELDLSLQTYYTQKIAWRDCKDEIECGKLTVPLDWSRPDGATVKLGLARSKASGKRLGSLVFNPGGPGVSVLSYVRSYEQILGDSPASHYDFVGFDPRGVGESDPVECVSDTAMDKYLASDSTPDDAGELEQQISEGRAFGAACKAETGELLGHVDTLSVVRDMDVLRAALGQEVLNFYGASYGTYLGAWYAQTFPWRVGRMLLDGAVDPALTTAEYLAGQATGFDRGLRAYVEDCLDHRGCPLRGTQEEALSQLDDLLDRADDAPLRTDDGSRPLTESLMATGMARGLYDDGAWSRLSEALKEALTGQGDQLLAMADEYNERDSKGKYGQVNEANPALFCIDHAETRTVEQIEQDAVALQERHPPLGGRIGWGSLGCREWPVPAVMKPAETLADGAAPILVVGTVGDPATPYEWAQGLSAQLESGRLLTWEGQGHTAFRRGSKCVDKAVTAYLVAGTLPAEGTRCPASRR